MMGEFLHYTTLGAQYRHHFSLSLRNLLLPPTRELHWGLEDDL